MVFLTSRMGINFQSQVAHQVNDGDLVPVLALRAEDAQLGAGDLRQEPVAGFAVGQSVGATNISVGHIGATVLVRRFRLVSLMDYPAAVVNLDQRGL